MAVDCIKKKFDNVEAFKKYLEGRKARNELGEGMTKQILETLTDESIDNFRDADSFNDVDKLRGYEVKKITLGPLKSSDNGWRYYVCFANDIGGEMVLKVCKEDYMRHPEKAWKEGTIQLETKTVEEMYEFVYKTSNRFFNEFDSYPEELYNMIQRVLSQDTTKVKLTIDVDTANWTLTLEYKDREPIVFER